MSNTPSEALRVYFLWAGPWNAIVLISILLFFLRRRSEFISIRCVPLVLLLNIALLLDTNNQILRSKPVIPMRRVPCLAVMGVDFFFYSLAFVTAIKRTVDLFVIWWRSRLELDLMDSGKDIPGKMGKRGSGMAWSQKLLWSIVRRSYRTRLADPPTTAFLGTREVDWRSKFTPRGWQKVTSSIFAALILSSIGFAMTIFFGRGNYLHSPVAMSPDCIPGDWLYGYILFFMWLSVSCLIINAISDVQDNYMLRKELTIILAIAYPVAILQVIFQFVLSTEVASTLTLGLGPSILLFMQDFIIWFVSIPVPLVWSYFYERSLRTFLSSHSKQEFVQMLRKPQILRLIEKMTLRDLCVENVRFLRELWQMRSNQDLSVSDAARELTLKYVVPGAPHELNLTSDTIREIVSADPETQSSNRLALFDRAEAEVVDLLYFNTFPKVVREERVHRARRSSTLDLFSVHSGTKTSSKSSFPSLSVILRRNNTVA